MFESGFLLGDGVWEGLRLHNGSILHLNGHLERLYNGAKLLDIKLNLSKKDLKQIGEKKHHLRMSIDSVNGAIQAVAFGFGNLFESVRDCKFINICYYIEENFWQGSTSVQLNIQDIEFEY